MGVQFRVIVPECGLCSMPTDLITGTVACNVLLGRGHAAGLMVATKEVPAWCQRILRAELLLNLTTDVGAPDEPFEAESPVYGQCEVALAQRTGEFLEAAVKKIPALKTDALLVVSLLSNMLKAIHRDRRVRAAHWQASLSCHVN